MKYILKIAVIISLFTAVTICQNEKTSAKYEASWQSVEKVNPVPEWFKDAKFGIYFHWGVYSVPAFGNEWYPRTMYFGGSPENKHHLETYGDIEKWPYNNFITGGYDKKGNFVQFAPELKIGGGKFDPDEWAQLFADAGAKFAGPVAEHHDGFSMWASKVNPWNAKDTGPKLDLVQLLADAIRKKNMKMILSMHHAYNITGFYEAVPPQDDPKLKMLFGQQGKENNEELWLNKLKEIIDNYRPDIVWQDFNLHIISQPILLQFLSYYYNKANEWNKEVAATYKDGLNKKCGVLDYERGGPSDLTDYYWLSDDAISSSSWCYTEGIGYYSKKQILQGLIDRVSKNGNLLLNISPKADGTIPQEQKDVLIAMGAWLKKYEEAIYSTRAWEKYGEGPTKMGAGHGVFIAPSEGTAEDIRYTRSKDNTTLYAILLGWNVDQKEVVLHSLTSNRIDLKSLRSVSLINGASGKYVPLEYSQDTSGLIVHLPERPAEEMAYVLKLNFDGKIPELNKYADLNCSPHYYLSSGENSLLGLNTSGKLSDDRKNLNQQWKLENVSHGIYKITNRENPQLVLSSTDAGYNLESLPPSGGDNQLWKIDDSFNGMLKITNVQHPDLLLSVDGDIKEGADVGLFKKENASTPGWKLLEVCELEQKSFKQLTIPGTIEAEDFDLGCPGDAYFDRDSSNAGGQYRANTGVDIEKSNIGGYNTGWTNSGEWMAYTVDVEKSGSYSAEIFFASVADGLKLHIECDGKNISGSIPLPNTGGYQNWKQVTTKLDLPEGKHVMKIYFDEAESRMNLDKVVFTAE
ncbi:MAG: alpha-L-fucosidase [Ignavibacteria bacterium]